MITCAECPYCKDIYPDKVDANGYPFRICGMTGNIVYTIPRKEKRYSGSGWIHYGVGGCGIWETAEAVLNHMTEPERRRYLENKQKQEGNNNEKGNDSGSGTDLGGRLRDGLRAAEHRNEPDGPDRPRVVGAE